MYILGNVLCLLLSVYRRNVLWFINIIMVYIAFRGYWLQSVFIITNELQRLGPDWPASDPAHPVFKTGQVFWTQMSGQDIIYCPLSPPSFGIYDLSDLRITWNRACPHVKFHKLFSHHITNEIWTLHTCQYCIKNRSVGQARTSLMVTMLW